MRRKGVGFEVVSVEGWRQGDEQVRYVLAKDEQQAIEVACRAWDTELQLRALGVIARPDEAIPCGPLKYETVYVDVEPPKSPTEPRGSVPEPTEAHVLSTLESLIRVQQAWRASPNVRHFTEWMRNEIAAAIRGDSTPLTPERLDQAILDIAAEIRKRHVLERAGD